VGAAAAASPAAAGLLAELTGKATASDAEDDAAAAEEDSAAPAGTSPGTVLFCGGTDWDKVAQRSTVLADSRELQRNEV
jgi:hypothetical protein